MRKILILAVAVGCGGGVSGEDPHAASTCDATREADNLEGAACEAACVTFRQFNANGDLLTCSTADAAVTCSVTITFDGVDGCCQLIDGGIVFDECLR